MSTKPAELMFVFTGTDIQQKLMRHANIQMLIPMKVDSDSDLIPVTRSDDMPVRFGA